MTDLQQGALWIAFLCLMFVSNLVGAVRIGDDKPYKKWDVFFHILIASCALAGIMLNMLILIVKK